MNTWQIIVSATSGVIGFMLFVEGIISYINRNQEAYYTFLDTHDFGYSLYDYDDSVTAWERFKKYRRKQLVYGTVLLIICALIIWFK